MIDGNLTVVDISFSSPSSLQVKGCILINGNLIVNLTQAELDELVLHPDTRGRPLIHYGSLCNPGSSQPVVTISSPSSCRKATGQSRFENNSLMVVISVSTANCNIWWRILVGVVGGVVVLVIVAIIVFLRSKRVAKFFRPYMKLDAPRSDTLFTPPIEDDRYHLSEPLITLDNEVSDSLVFAPDDD
jgi:hypothetical protein